MRIVYLLILILALPACASAGARFETSAGTVEAIKIADGFSRPWSLAFLPGGELLVTERDEGRLILVSVSGDKSEVAGVPTVASHGQGGLLDIVPAKDFSTSRTLFFSYAEPAEKGQRTALASALLSADGSRLQQVRVLFRMDYQSRSGAHFGGRIVENPDGTLFLTLGDRGHRRKVQESDTHNGKLIRVNRDGTIPDDNPSSREMPPEAWSKGHRNPQGAALDELGRIWTVSHGARGGDEVNRPEAGKNYGWAEISYGTHYTGEKIGVGSSAPGMEQPIHYWDPSIAPSGMIIYSGKLFPAWTGDILVGSLKFDFVSRLDRQGDRIVGEEKLFNGDFNRVRDLREDSQGRIWIVAEGDGAIYMLVPANS